MPAAQFELPKLTGVAEPISRCAGGKNLLSMSQLEYADVDDYLNTAAAAEAFINDPEFTGFPILPGIVMKAIMRQPSTRTGGSMTTATAKLGGYGELISGMSSSSEAKGETLEDSWAAFATQSDILGIRTAEAGGPRQAAEVIEQMYERAQLSKIVPVINCGDGQAEHPTQALGDLFTIKKEFGDFSGRTLTVFGDHERYRAFHSLFIGAKIVGMTVVAVESAAAPTPQSLVDFLGNSLTQLPAHQLSDALKETDVLYIGRNPDEYEGADHEERLRSKVLAKDYSDWIITNDRLEQMPETSIVLHPRPRRTELDTSCDGNPRVRDIKQMINMIPMRAAIIARHLGKTIPIST